MNESIKESMHESTHQPRWRWLPLAAVAAAATVLDLGKPVHIDDTAYLEIARWIIGHPLHPMMGRMNWANTADPISNVSQPHLMFYLMAAVMRLAPGAVELAMHVVWVAMSAATVFLFHALARALGLRRPLVWTALLCVGPAFIPSQNLMVDVPLLGVWIACLLMLVRAGAPGETASDPSLAGRRLLLAATLAGVACLIKYTSLVLLPIVGLAIWWRGDRRRLAVLLVPLGLLAAWSLFNWFDYGGVHLLARPVTSAKAPGLGATVGLIVGRMGLWLIALGAILPGTLAFAPALWRTRSGRVVIVACAVIASITIVVGHLAFGAEPPVQSALRGLFVGNGLLGAALAVRGYWQARTEPHTRLLAAWALGAAGFIILLSLFIAVRHVLVALPALMLLIARGRDAERLSRRATRVAVGLTAFLGVALGVSDFELAATYRVQAPLLAADACTPGSTCFTSGHWGWQWYSAKAGFVGYDSERSVLHTGDRFVVPELVSQQTLRPADAARLVRLGEVEIPASPLTLIRTIATEKSRAQGNRSGGYYYFWTSVPWTLTTRPLERFRIYEVR